MLKYNRVLAAYWAYSSRLKMESVHSSETLVNFYQALQCHIPEDNTVHSLPCECQISHKLRLLFKASFLNFLLKEGKETVKRGQDHFIWFVWGFSIILPCSSLLQYLHCCLAGQTKWRWPTSLKCQQTSTPQHGVITHTWKQDYVPFFVHLCSWKFF
jgi:hypothetical protein